MTSFCLSSAPTASLISNPKTLKPPSAASSSRRLRAPIASMFSPRRNQVLTCNYYSRKSYQRGKSQVVRMAPEEEKLTRRNPLDFPVEWDRPKPGRRPDIFPQFSPMKTPLPPPLPYDPPEEDEEDEDKKEEEEDPEKEEQEQPEKQ